MCHNVKLKVKVLWMWRCLWYYCYQWTDTLINTVWHSCEGRAPTDTCADASALQDPSLLQPFTVFQARPLTLAYHVMSKYTRHNFFRFITIFNFSVKVQLQIQTAVTSPPSSSYIDTYDSAALQPLCSVRGTYHHHSDTRCTACVCG